MSPRFRFLGRAGLALGVAWLLALAGFGWARATKPTAQRLARYLRGTHLGGLSGPDRARALRRLADQLNALSAEERRRARMGRQWQPWFEEMTEAERVEFIEATAPSGFRQMLGAFEALPDERRGRAIDEAVKRLREARAAAESGEPGESVESGDASPLSGPGTLGPPLVLSDELRERVTAIGLQAYYSQSSARTKAELAPLLEELQQAMEGGQLRRGPPRSPRP